jgi:hypothetical protein
MRPLMTVHAEDNQTQNCKPLDSLSGGQDDSHSVAWSSPWTHETTPVATSLVVVSYLACYPEIIAVKCSLSKYNTTQKCEADLSAEVWPHWSRNVPWSMVWHAPPSAIYRWLCLVTDDFWTTRCQISHKSRELVTRQWETRGVTLAETGQEKSPDHAGDQMPKSATTPGKSANSSQTSRLEVS